MLSRFIRGFLLSDPISNTGGFFELLCIDGSAELFSHLQQLGVHRRRLGLAARDLPSVPDLPVNAPQKRFQADAEDIVIVRAAQAPLGTKLHILYATRRAGQSRQLIALGANVLTYQGLHNPRQIDFFFLGQLLFFRALLA
jgi:hypothetical protein